MPYMTMKDGTKPLKIKSVTEIPDDYKGYMFTSVAVLDRLNQSKYNWICTGCKRYFNKEHPEKNRLGASTISQQTAKNVFLWPGRSWVRKGLEAYFTVLIEVFWSKERIMEVYLNSIEMGPGIYGVQAVAEEHFGCDAKDLTPNQCALIAATLPNPRRFSSKEPSRYMKKRQRQIRANMRYVKPLEK
jgi:monofunctional biosynthetic peptidoglycan transglycosylase